MRVRVDRGDSGDKEVDMLRMTPSLSASQGGLRSIRSSLGGQADKARERSGSIGRRLTAAPRSQIYGARQGPDAGLLREMVTGSSRAWLLLAPKPRFGPLAGTVRGTASAALGQRDAVNVSLRRIASEHVRGPGVRRVDPTVDFSCDWQVVQVLT